MCKSRCPPKAIIGIAAVLFMFLAILLGIGACIGPLASLTLTGYGTSGGTITFSLTLVEVLCKGALCPSGFPVALADIGERAYSCNSMPQVADITFCAIFKAATGASIATHVCFSLAIILCAVKIFFASINIAKMVKAADAAPHHLLLRRSRVMTPRGVPPCLA